MCVCVDVDHYFGSDVCGGFDSSCQPTKPHSHHPDSSTVLSPGYSLYGRSQKVRLGEILGKECHGKLSIGGSRSRPTLDSLVIDSGLSSSKFKYNHTHFQSTMPTMIA